MQRGRKDLPNAIGETFIDSHEPLSVFKSADRISGESTTTLLRLQRREANSIE
jgi:hypothetical protein